MRIKGVSIPSYGISIVSVSYLKSKKHNFLYDSLAKMILYEMGHLYGLQDHYIIIKPQKILEDFKIISECVMDKIKISGGLRDWLEFYTSKFLSSIFSKIIKIYKIKSESLFHIKGIYQVDEEFIKVGHFIIVISALRLC